MRIKNYLICLIAAVALVAAACGDTEGTNSDGGNGDSNGNNSDYEVLTAEEEAAVEDYLVTASKFLGDANDILCECNYEAENYESAEACRDERVPTDQEIDDSVVCLKKEIDENGEAIPEKAMEFMDCYTQVTSEYSDCFEPDSNQDVCSEDANMARAACMEDFESDMGACDAIIENDEASQTWEEEIGDEAFAECVPYFDN